MVAAGFALQTLTGALTYLLPVVFGRGAWGNRRLTAILELGWPPRVAAVNLGVLALVAGLRAGAGLVAGRAGAGQLRAPGRGRAGVGGPPPPLSGPAQPAREAARASAALPRRQAVKIRPARATSLSSIRPIA